MPVAAPTKAELDEFFRENRRRLELNREAKRIDDKCSPLKKRLIEFVKEVGGTDRTTVRHGYVLSLDVKRGVPKYKEHFLLLATADQVAALDRDVPMNEQLSVEPVAAAE